MNYSLISFTLIGFLFFSSIAWCQDTDVYKFWVYDYDSTKQENVLLSNGFLHEVGDSSLVIKTPSNLVPDLRIDVSSIHIVRYRRMGNVRTGVIIGAALGAILGYVADSNENFSACNKNPLCSTLGAGLSGGVIFGLLGSKRQKMTIFKKQSLYNIQKEQLRGYVRK